jgi:hypothetical protein
MSGRQGETMSQKPVTNRQMQKPKALIYTPQYVEELSQELVRAEQARLIAEQRAKAAEKKLREQEQQNQLLSTYVQSAEAILTTLLLIFDVKLPKGVSGQLINALRTVGGDAFEQMQTLMLPPKEPTAGEGD